MAPLAGAQRLGGVATAAPRQRLRFVRGLGCATLLASSTLVLSVRAADPPATEYQVKAAFLYNFARFVDWPAAAFADSSSSLVIGVLGVDPFGEVLDHTVAGKKVASHPLQVRRCTAPAEAIRCHMLFIAASEEENLTRTLATLENHPVLTVGETADFARRGGMLQFVMRSERLGFEVNVAAASRARLEISSKLLRLAAAVHRSP
jgi:uncharacterized protein DUF4154